MVHRNRSVRLAYGRRSEQASPKQKLGSGAISGLPVNHRQAEFEPVRLNRSVGSSTSKSEIVSARIPPGDIGVFQDLSKQDLYLTTLAAPTVCGSSASLNQKVCLPGSNFRIGDDSTRIGLRHHLSHPPDARISA